jgi:predicted nucleic acid-binding protein
VILLDTNVMSELMKALPDPVVERWFLLNEEQCHIATIAIGELAYGIAKLDADMRKARLGEQLTEWRVRFAARAFAFDMAAAVSYGDILAESRTAGRTMSIPDAQIASIAREQGCALATRNVKDFVTTGLMLINPWTD